MNNINYVSQLELENFELKKELAMYKAMEEERYAQIDEDLNNMEMEHILSNIEYDLKAIAKR